MTFSSVVDADPDPTSQIAWPGARGKRTTLQDASSAGATLVEDTLQTLGDGGPDEETRPGKRRLTLMDLFNLSVSMGGAQVAWTVELGYVSRARC